MGWLLRLGMGLYLGDRYMSNLVQEALEVCWAIEECGASVELTNAVSKASALYHKLNDRRDFGWAIEQLKAGNKVARAGWNGKGMWVVMMPSLYLPPFNSQEPGAKVNDRTARHIGEDMPLDCQPYMVMWTADKKWQPGWLASQADMLAEDWSVV